MTLEGQIVRIADIVAYVNHDLDDAIRAGAASSEDVPRELIDTRARRDALGSASQRMVRDLVERSRLDEKRA